MIRRVAALALVSVLLSALPANAQVAPTAPETLAVGEWQLAPLFDLRVRGEYRRDLDDRTRGMLIERARIGVDAQRGPLQVRVVLQDARARDLAAATDFVEGPLPQAGTGAYEAWAQAQSGSFHPSFVRVGRQPVVWGEGRLLGANDWSASGRSLDAVRGRLVVGDGAFEALGAILEDTSPASGPVPTAYGELFGVRGEWAFDPLFALEGYAVARLAQANPADNRTNLEASIKGETYAGALRLWGDGQGWTWAAEVACELGHADALSIRREAWAVAGHVARTLEPVLLTPTFQAGASYASGNNAKESSATYRAFDPLLADVHVWHGAMDVFSWSNEEEVSGRASIAPLADFVAAVEYRYARLAQAAGSWRSGYLTTIGQSPSGVSGELGHEVDASAEWSPWVAVDLAAGYSVLILGDGAREIVGVPAARVAHFAFAQASARF